MNRDSRTGAAKKTPANAQTTRTQSDSALKEEDLARVSGGIIAVCRKAGGDPN